MKKRKPRERIAKWPNEDREIGITISTYCPSKWLFVDRETGNVWKWDTSRNHFVRA